MSMVDDAYRVKAQDQIDKGVKYLRSNAEWLMVLGRPACWACDYCAIGVDRG